MSRQVSGSAQQTERWHRHAAAADFCAVVSRCAPANQRFKNKKVTNAPAWVT